MKHRISVTIDKNVISQIDEIIDGYRLKNRSHAMEFLLQKSLGDHVPKKALILAGGRGAKLRPLTYELPKPLMPVQGKILIEHLFDLLKKYEINNAVLAVGYMKEKIKEHLGDGKKFGINIAYTQENEPLGTAGPLKLAKEHFDRAFIVSNSDELMDIDIPEMFKLHKSKKALATIALTTIKDPSKYGSIRLSGSKITEFIEKPKGKAPSNLINSGFYIIEPEVIEMIPKGFSMLERDVFPRLAEEGRLFGYPFSGQWFHIDDIGKYETAIKEWRGINV